MWTSLRVAATGMQAHQRALDVAANNLANLQTTGYKSRRANLVDQPPEEVAFGVPGDPTGVTLDRREVGQGARIDGIVANLSAGPIQPTGRSLDLAIAGEGYLAVIAPNGEMAYTRDGSLQIDSAGRLVTGSGALVAPGITVPADAAEVAIAQDGTVLAELIGGGSEELGALQLVRFANPDGLEAVGQNLLVATATSGPATAGVPGQDGFGPLLSGSLEGSNVDTGDEMLRMMHAQRAYQLNVRALKTVDEMLQGANNLRR